MLVLSLIMPNLPAIDDLDVLQLYPQVAGGEVIHMHRSLHLYYFS